MTATAEQKRRGKLRKAKRKLRRAGKSPSEIERIMRERRN